MNAPHAPTAPLEPAPDAKAAWPAPPYRVPPGWAPPVPYAAPAPARPARPFAPRDLAALVALVVVTDVAVFSRAGDAPGGLGLAAFFTAVPLVVLASARARRRSPTLAVVATLLALVVARCLWAPTAGTFLAGSGLALAFALLLRTGRLHVPEVLASLGRALPAMPSRTAGAFRGLGRLAARARVDRAAVLPVAIPAALCAAFVGVFALANPLVARVVKAAFEAVTRHLELPSPGRVFVWTVAVAGGAVLLRPRLVRMRGREDAVTGGEAEVTQLAIARNALVALNALFVGYHVLDAAFLWAGSPPPGTTTQAYAHQGAFWLTVALAMLTAVVGVLFRGALADDARAAKVRVLAYAWAAQGLVLALGTYRRIGMHVAKSGLSDLRIVGILGTTLVASGLVLVLYKLRRQRSFGWLVRRQLDALALTAVVYVLFPTHLVSARVNVARIEAGEYRPLLHMFRQSKQVESTAALLPLLDHPDARVRQGVAALLDAERDTLTAERDAARSWHARDLGSPRALAALEGVRPRTGALLAGVDPDAAREVLLEISRFANEDRSLEELLAIPSASMRGGGRGERDVY